MYDIKFNDKFGQELGLKISTRPDIPQPKREYDTIKIDGQDGSLYVDKETYEDIEIVINFNYVISDFSQWCALTREIKKWLCNVSDNKLILSDDYEFFYKVKKVDMGKIERIYKKAGNMEVKFICDPYIYLSDGKIEVPLSGNIYNPFDISKPIYKITGEGMCTLTVNGNSATINVGQSLIIDTGLKLCYRDGQTSNTSMTGDFDDLILKSGNNEIFYTGSFTVNIIPNWRCL